MIRETRVECPSGACAAVARDGDGVVWIRIFSVVNFQFSEHTAQLTEDQAHALAQVLLGLDK